MSKSRSFSKSWLTIWNGFGQKWSKPDWRYRPFFQFYSAKNDESRQNLRKKEKILYFHTDANFHIFWSFLDPRVSSVWRHPFPLKKRSSIVLLTPIFMYFHYFYITDFRLISVWCRHPFPFKKRSFIFRPSVISDVIVVMWRHKA